MISGLVRLRPFLVSSLVGAGMAQAQVSMKLGDFVIFDSVESQPISHINRDSGVITPIVTRGTDSSGSEQFRSNGEIDQYSDGNFYIADLPFSHTLRVDPHFGPSAPGNLTAFEPQTGPDFGYTFIPENLAILPNGDSLRIGSKSSGQGAVIRHSLTTNQTATLSEGNLLTGNIAAAAVTVNGDVLVAQKGASANLIFVNGTTGAQSLIGTSNYLSGEIYDLEALPNNKVALTTGSQGLIIGSYTFNSGTQKFEATWQNLGNFGGSVQWVKADVDGNPIASVYFSPTNTRLVRYNLTAATSETILGLNRLTSFAVVKYPVQQREEIALQRSPNNALQVSFKGRLQSSTDLLNWQTLTPQPASPFTVTSPKEKEFFRVLGEATEMEGNILFRGNSYTYGQDTTNQTPVATMLKALTGSQPYTADTYAISAYSFKDHVNDPQSLAKVQSNHWKYAVLQNFSTGPTTAGNITDHFNYGRDLYLQQINQDPDCHVLLYETPAYRFNTSGTYPTPFKNPAAFQSQLTLNYRALAQRLNNEFPTRTPVEVVPAGRLVQIAGGLLPDTNRFYVPMHATDGQHMNDNRLALTGLAFYVALTHSNPEGLLSTPSVEALNLNITADKRWLEKLVWRYMTTGTYPIIFTQEPVSREVSEGQTFSFAVAAEGSGPITYQWFRNDVALPGETLNTFSRVATGDFGSTYYCIATNSEGAVKSNVATITQFVQQAQVVAYVDFSAPGFDTTFAAAPNDPVNRWNNWRPSVGDIDLSTLPASLALVNPAGTASGVTLQSIVKGTATGPSSPAPLTGTPFAGNAACDFWYGDSAHPEIRIGASGLLPQQTYRITFFATRSGVNDNRQARYTVTGNGSALTADLDASNNLTNTAVISNINPTPEGTITISVKKGPSNNNTSGFYYLGVMKLEVE